MYAIPLPSYHSVYLIVVTTLFEFLVPFAELRVSCAPSKESELPLKGDESIMRKKAHGTRYGGGEGGSGEVRREKHMRTRTYVRTDTHLQMLSCSLSQRAAFFLSCSISLSVSLSIYVCMYIHV